MAGSTALFATTAQRSAVHFAPDSDRILEVVIENGGVSQRPVVVYPFDGRWYVPLGQLSEALGLAVQVWPSGSGAEGFIIDPNRDFRLDTLSCNVRIAGTSSHYACEDVHTFENDIYVTEALLGKWLPLELRVDPVASQLIVKPQEKLPFQSRFDREVEAKSAGQVSNVERPPFELVPATPGYFGVAALDQQLSVSSAIPPAKGPYLNAISNLAGELVGLRALLTANFDERRINGARLNFSRRDSEPFVGSLKLRDVELWNLDVPTFPLLAPVQPGTGVLVSSFSPDQPINFDKTDFQGPLPENWEVLLYLNDVLIDRRVGDASGVYRFNNVQLQYGPNQFKLAFFGPNGQRYEEYKNLAINGTLKRAGELDYRISATSLSRGEDLFTGEISYGVAQKFSVFAQGYLERMTANRFLLVGALGLGPGFSYTARYAFSESGGRALELGLITGYRSVSLGLKHTELQDFKSLLFNVSGPTQKRQTEATVAFHAPVLTGLSFRGTAVHREFVAQASDTVIRAQATTSFRSVQVQTGVDWSPGASVPFLGRTEVLYFPPNLRFRFALDYDTTRPRGAELEFQYVQSNAWQGGVKFVQPFDGTSRRYEARASRLFPQWSLGLFATAGLISSAGVQANFTLLRDRRSGGITLTRTAATGQGLVSVRAFLDTNENNQFDPGERVISDMGFTVCESDPRYTDASGSVVVGGLSPRLRCDILPAEARDPDPFIRPAKPGFTTYPAEGTTIEIDYPFRAVGQIDGYVNAVSKGVLGPRRGVLLELVDVKDGRTIARTRSDGFGFYAFEQVRAGAEYRVRVVEAPATGERVSATPPAQRVALPEKGAFVSDVNFTVK